MIQIKNIKEKLINLSKDINNLWQLMRDATDKLKEERILPEENIDEALRVTREQFLCLRKTIFNFADTLNIKHEHKAISFRSLETIFESVEKTYKEKDNFETLKADILVLLQKAESISYKNGKFPSLGECKISITNLYRTLSEINWPESDPDVEKLFNGTHPFIILIKIIENGENLSDEDCTLMFEKVSEEYGKTLALAAIRGKLSIHSKPEEQEVSAGDKSEGETVVAEISEEEVAAEQEVSAGDKSEEETVVAEISEEEVAAEQEVSAGDKSEEETVVAEISEEEVAEPDEQEVLTEDKPDFSSANNSSELATIILDTSINQQPQAIRELIWHLINEEHLGIAYHLTLYLEEKYSVINPRLPSWAIRLMILGPHIRYGGGLLSLKLGEDFHQYSTECYADKNPSWNHAVRLILAAGSMKAALLAPTIGASRVLHDLKLKEGLLNLYDLSKEIATFGDQGYPLDPTALAKVKDEAAWNDELQKLRKEADEWLTRERNAKLNYHSASQVWQLWLKPSGLICKLIETVKEDGSDSIDDKARRKLINDITTRISEIYSDQLIDKKVNETNKKELRHSVKIEARALRTIRSKVYEAIELLNRWLELQNSRINRKRDSKEHIDRLRTMIQKCKQSVFIELDSFLKNHNAICVQAAGKICKKILEDIIDLFESQKRLPGIELKIKCLLNSGLLLIPSLHVDDEWEPEHPYNAELIRTILTFISAGNYEWSQAFDRYLRNKDHEATKRILDFLEQTGVNIQSLSAKHEESLKECKKSLERDLRKTEREIENAVAFGLLGEDDRLKFDAQIRSIEGRLNEIVRFSPEHEVLRGVQKAIAAKRQSEIEAVRQRLNSELKSEHPEYNKISSVLDSGDVHTANEYISIVLSKEALPEHSESKDSFIDFFRDKFKNIEGFLEPERSKDSPNWGNIVQDLKRHAGHIRGRLLLGPVDLTHIRGNQARESADLIESWFTIKQTGRLQNQEHLIKIMECLGFSDVSAIITKQGKSVWAEVRVRPVTDRTICPVAAYGSASYGHYRILCLWSRPSEDEILNEVGDTSVGSPVIVFHFGRLTEKRRRSLAALCWQRRRTFLTVDDMLILYLCGEKQSRLPAMFACTLPFTFIEPYITTSGLVPPEVFYGREWERDSVLQPGGSCFIYGGRQLGKTALLRDVERRFHSPDDGRIAVWIDLKTSGIGWDRSIDDIWSLITAKFKEYKVIPSSMPANASITIILQHIRAWLEEDKSRRILLLLDEADRFLESDGKGESFIRASYLKGLMEQTERRFKVVFAGLHNVQRTTKLSNHPLAHYGEPICIGPLLDKGEWREAYALVSEPLSQCGFRFEPRDLIMRILSQTNFYPSLIQLYCSQVLRHVNDSRVRVFTPDESPPYTLKSDHVEGAYQSQYLRKAVRDRFIWTLQLDKRYEVIAYSIAYGCLLNRESGLNQGFSLNWIEEQVLEHWPEGFPSQHTDIPLQSLLEEMVGLGLLREIKHEKERSYTLRNANVLLLIGTEDEILTQLATPRERDPDYEAATFRSVYRGTDQSIDYSKRNPLTAMQERELRSHSNGVTIIVGSSISGLDDLKDFVEAGGPNFFIDAKDCIHNTDFSKRLDKLSDRQQNGTTILYVSHECPWNRKWVEEAVNKTKRMSSKERFSRIVFVADPSKTWQIQDDLDDLFDRISPPLSLQPWHDSMLRQWLDDCHYQSKKEYREQIFKVTGNWPGLLGEFHRRAKSDQHQWKKHLDSIHTEISSENGRAKWLEKFGLSIQQSPSRIIREMADYEDTITVEELSDLSGVQLSDVNRTVRWAEMLAIVYRDRGGYRINDIVVNLIKNHPANF